MKAPKLAQLEMRIMDALWNRGPSAIREIQEAFPEDDRPAYTTIQTTVYRMEAKRAIRRVRKISNAHIFEAAVTRQAARGRLVDELLAVFGGRPQPVIAHLVETGKLTFADLDAARAALRRLNRAPSGND